MAQKHSWLVPLIFLTLLFYLNFVARVLLSPLAPVMEAELGYTHAGTGSLFLLISLGYFVGLFASGEISSRWTFTQTIQLSVVGFGLSLIFIAFSRSYLQIGVFVTLLGFMSGLYLPAGMAKLMELIPSAHWGKGLAVHELGPNCALFIAPLQVEVLLHFFDWHQVLLCQGLLTLGIVGAHRLYAGQGGSRGIAPRLATFKDFFRQKNFWKLVLLFGMGVGSTLGIYSMLPVYFIDQGIERDLGNGMLSASRTLSIPVVLVGGWLTDRIGVRRSLRIILVTAGLLTASIGVLQGYWIFVPVFLQPLLAVCFFPPAFKALALSVPAELRNQAIAYTVPFGFLLGAGVGPLMLGMLGDAGLFQLAFVGLGCLMAAGSLLTRDLVEE
ncbi:MAG: MFS transporter [Desulfuromonadales bacterium]|nr:MFS transporter [Desulfuromonadales bacterium]MBN2791470.1 MFS transporter [Desulfuromonadales bacterium]